MGSALTDFTLVFGYTIIIAIIIGLKLLNNTLFQLVSVQDTVWQCVADVQQTVVLVNSLDTQVTQFPG